MARVDHQLDHNPEGQTQKIRSRPPQLGTFDGVLIDGNLLSQSEVLGGKA